jgi:hypothetical protein
MALPSNAARPVAVLRSSRTGRSAAYCSGLIDAVEQASLERLARLEHLQSWQGLLPLADQRPFLERPGCSLRGCSTLPGERGAAPRRSATSALLGVTAGA